MDKKAILLDDDILIGKIWQISARSAGVSLSVFQCPQELFKRALPRDRETPFYVDMNLKASQTGEEVAKKIFECGYFNIYLATGHPLAHFKGLLSRPWIKKIIGKEPPWKAC